MGRSPGSPTARNKTSLVEVALARAIAAASTWGARGLLSRATRYGFMSFARCMTHASIGTHSDGQGSRHSRVSRRSFFAKRLRPDAVRRRGLRVRVGARMMLGMALAPEARPSRGALDGDAICTRRRDPIPDGRRLRPVRQNGTRCVTHQTLGDRTEEQSFNPTRSACADDEKV